MDDDLTTDERTRLAALACEETPPPQLEDAVLARLRAEGLLAPKRRAWIPIAIAAVLATITFFGGLTIGRRSAHDDTHDGPQFLLLLYNDPSMDRGSGAAAIVQEYREWGMSLHRQGSLVAAEKLTSESVLVGADAGTRQPSGYFVIRAKDVGEAVAIAQRSPHARRGGTIAVRPIDG